MLRDRNKPLATLLAAGLLGIGAALPAQVVKKDEPELSRIGVDEHLGEKLPPDLRFVDDTGDTVRLGDYFNGDMPAVLVLHYSDCPMLCSLVLNGLAQVATETRFEPGRDYRILTVSINPDEPQERARMSKERYIKSIRPGAPPQAWTFFVGSQENITALTKAVGFRYYRVKESGQFAHPAVLMMLTPQGVLSRYLYGIEFPERDFRLGLVEASEGKIGTTVDRLILYCYHYDPDAKGYVVFAGNLMRIGGVVTLTLLGLFLGALLLRERRRNSDGSKP